MRKLIFIVLFLSSCAGSKYAVKQNELMKRGMGGPKGNMIYWNAKK